MIQTRQVKNELLDPLPQLEDKIYTTFLTQVDGPCKVIQSSRPYTDQTQEEPEQTKVRARENTPDKIAETKATTETQNVETRTDFMSIKGVFGWTVIDNVNIPYILRNDKQFVAVRIVEPKLLSCYPNVYPDDLGKQAPLISFFITCNEAKLLNEINLHHCAGEYGRKEFTTKDLIVLLSDFLEFFRIVKKTFPDGQATMIKSELESVGWLQIQNTLTPYVKRNEYKYVPLSVIQYSAVLLNNETLSENTASPKECALLNNGCRNAGVDFTFSASTKLVQVDDLLRVASVEIVELPSSNPLKHVTYMELSTNNPNQSLKQKPKPTCDALAPSINTHPYRFKPPLSQIDLLKTHEKLAGTSKTNSTRTQLTYPQNQNLQMNSIVDKRIYQNLPQNLQVSQQSARPFSSVPSDYVDDPNTPAVNSQINTMIQFYAKQGNAAQNGDPALATGPPNKTLRSGMYCMNNQIVANRIYGYNLSPGITSSTPSPMPMHPLQPRPSSRPPTGPTFSPTCQSPSQFQVSDIQARGSCPQPLFYVNHGIQQTVSLPRLPGSKQPRSGIVNHSRANILPKQIQGIVIPMKGYLMVNPVKQHQASDSQNAYHHVKKPHNAHQDTPGLSSPTGSHPNAISTLIPAVSQIVSSSPVVSATNNITKGVAANCVPDSTNYIHAEPVHVVSGAVNTANFYKTTAAPPQTVPATGNISQPVPIQVVSGQPMEDKPLHKTVVLETNKTVHSNDIIEGVLLNNKSVSCVHLDKPDRCGRYCLVEAVCRLYFNGYNVIEFIYALENILNVNLLTCDNQEEKAFIRYYSLKVDKLKCNKLIKIDDLENFYPQISYMFPDKTGQDLGIHVQQNNVEWGMSVDQEHNIINKLVVELEESMPGTVSEMVAGEKRKCDDMVENGLSHKQQKLVNGTDEADDVIILD